MASSMASRVPEPIEKCAVCRASPSNTLFTHAPASVAHDLECARPNVPDRVVGNQLIAAQNIGEHVLAVQPCFLESAYASQGRSGRLMPYAIPARMFGVIQPSIRSLDDIAKTIAMAERRNTYRNGYCT